MIRVLVVEDSPVVREFLVYLLRADPEIDVVGTAANGERAVEAAQHLQPDVITMDIHMPEMNGFDATRRIMETAPTRIVIVSGSSTTEEIATTFLALESGALAVVKRPAGIGHPDHEATSRDLLQTVKLMSEVSVVRRWPSSRRAPPAAERLPEAGIKPAAAEVKLVAVGASTGGPLALQSILAVLPKNLGVPILVVQHISPGFTEGLAEWLTGSSGLPVHVAADGDHLAPGHVFIAPEGFQLGIRRGGTISVARDEPENGHCPSISYLFRSVAEVFGAGAIGVLLTGMGRDGAAELKLMREKGAITIAQDRESSVVHGMPGEAIRMGAATHVLPLGQIAAALSKLADKQQ
ncbi:MAG: chemotaxis response regulator protein-glutamate methylesterase [Betaproteobacteria bacterium]|nr:chemotaxis response regulator protein-glutamate methylesterase [Betaproteobacteria bacterium]